MGVDTSPGPGRTKDLARSYEFDAVVVGSGPNGLAAAIELAKAGCSVLVLEAGETVGGGLRSAELTLPGFTHDICSAIHPLGYDSPFFRTLPLNDFGLSWIQPHIPVAQTLEDGMAVALHRSIEDTIASLGRDGQVWRRLFKPVLENWQTLAPAILGPRPDPGHPLALAAFGIRAMWPARYLAEILFREAGARALFGGLALHAIQPLENLFTTSFALVLGILGHAVGWPFPQGGAQSFANALADYFQSLGGEICTGEEIRSLDELPACRVALLDVAPKGFLQMAGHNLPSGYRNQLHRYRYGPGVFKIDYALEGPVPWLAPACLQAGTIHVGGSLWEMAVSEREVWRGRHPERPFVLVAQQSLFDRTRAPAGKHTLWAYSHVPHGSNVDMTAVIERQIERFAPGFHDLILARHVHGPAQLQAYNANYVGGDINGGVQDLRQMWTRPTRQLNPYATPLPGVFLCSSATPPGGGVHGMCGYHAARAALRTL